MNAFRLPLLSLSVILLFASVMRADEDTRTLRKSHGPCLVLVQTFRGRNSEESAQALATELKDEHGIPAYLYQLGLQPSQIAVYAW